jgi:hypothetical protein
MNPFRSFINFFKSHPAEQEPPVKPVSPGFNAKFNDPGIFTYHDDGFEIALKEGSVKLNWDDIDELVAYKADMYTFDEIRMDIVYGGMAITITEETPGWHQFVLKTKKVFPSILQDWDSKIIYPPFATNLTELSKKKDHA